MAGARALPKHVRLMTDDADGMTREINESYQAKFKFTYKIKIIYIDRQNISKYPTERINVCVLYEIIILTK